MPDFGARRADAPGVLALLAGVSILSPAVRADTGQSKVSPGVEAPAERLPTDVRRVTLIVRDIEASLRLYRDVVGLKVNYDTVVGTSGVALPAGEPGAKARLRAAQRQ